ncbi:hypothetical protein SALBM217S_08401 [Streptomyces griseoloalbus]
MQVGRAQTVLEVDADRAARPQVRREGGHVAGVVAEAVLRVDGEQTRQRPEGAGETQGLLTGGPGPVGQPRRRGDAQAGGADGGEAVGVEEGRGGVVPGVGEQEGAVLAVEGGEGLRGAGGVGVGHGSHARPGTLRRSPNRGVRAAHSGANACISSSPSGRTTPYELSGTSFQAPGRSPRGSETIRRASSAMSRRNATSGWRDFSVSTREL